MTVGIVLVSHSAPLAEGLAELLAQIGSSDVPVAVAGGTSDGRLGTSVELVEKAIQAAEAGDGVVIIPDLGSSVLTVRTVLAEDSRDRAIMVDCPFVEGSVAAAVTASTGASRDEVAEAARQARDVPKF